MLSESVGESLVAAAYLGVVLAIVIAFIKLVVDVAAIRTMLQNTGLFSGFACPSCGMAIPKQASVCGHCGRAVEVPTPRP